MKKKGRFIWRGWKRSENAAVLSSMKKKIKTIPSHKKAVRLNEPAQLFYYLELLEDEEVLLLVEDVLNVSFRSLSFTSMSAFFMTFEQLPERHCCHLVFVQALQISVLFSYHRICRVLRSF